LRIFNCKPHQDHRLQKRDFGSKFTTKNRLAAGLCQNPLGSLQSSPSSLAGFRGWPWEGRGRVPGKGKKRGGARRGRRGMGPLNFNNVVAPLDGSPRHCYRLTYTAISTRLSFNRRQTTRKQHTQTRRFALVTVILTQSPSYSNLAALEMVKIKQAYRPTIYKGGLSSSSKVIVISRPVINNTYNYLAILFLC